MIIICILFYLLDSKCVDQFNTTPTSESYIVWCPFYLPNIFPTSCSCGMLPLWRFTIFDGFGYFECYCNGNNLQYGYARAFCCDDNINYTRTAFIDHKIRDLNTKIKQHIKPHIYD